MSKYTITAGQNLYDVALHIYGSIEGITDLLINNPTLSMASRLSAGQELIYTDDYQIDADVVSYYRQRNICPANGERSVYFKEPHHPQIVEFRLSAAAPSTGVSLCGSGVMEIDWGDNTPLQCVELSNKPQTLSHFFDNKIADRRIIRLYGDFRLKQIDFTALNPSAVFLLNPVYAEEVTLRGCTASLDFLPLLEGLYALDLTKIKTASLLPVVQCRGLKRLDLSGIDVLRETLDELLIALVREYCGRRNCEIILSEYPSGEYREPPRDEALNYLISTGMEAIWLLTHEPAWNEGGPWIIRIGERCYQYTSAEQSAPGHDDHSEAMTENRDTA